MKQEAISCLLLLWPLDLRSRYPARISLLVSLQILQQPSESHSLSLRSPNHKKVTKIIRRRRCKREEPTTLPILSLPHPIRDKSIHKHICLCCCQLFLCMYTQHIWVKLSPKQSHFRAVTSAKSAAGDYIFMRVLPTTDNHMQKTFCWTSHCWKTQVFRGDRLKGFQFTMCCERILQTKYEIEYACVPVAPVSKWTSCLSLSSLAQ